MFKKLNAKAAGLIAGTALGITALTGSSLPPNQVQPAPDAEMGTQAVELQVAVSCFPGGDYAWNATLVDGPANSSFFVQNIYTYSYVGGGAFGSYQWKYAGQLSTGQYGIGTSSTFYGEAGPDVEEVVITARVLGAGDPVGTGSDTC
ncbi:hypothetical protein GCM10027404_22370 [Arthrobacter tumbae]|uniref:hypothetical protein n=1 Tax=Arthrobacter tumbae TaxID=163874 RepID=UPI00195DBC80|nr:hypothetical protein [Arthrobacter tumbae]MBM7781810.1 hypothetical protein [Arthrobacter tumbae]